MKLIKIILFYIIIVTSSLLGGCNKAEPIPINVKNVQKISDVSSGIDIEANTLTSSDAAAVAMMYLSSRPETRGQDARNIESIITVADKEVPLLYGVNYDDGYTLVSATKNWYPILADVEHGHFDGNKTDTGADILLEEFKNCIRAANADSSLRVNRSVWFTFEKKPVFDRIATRSGFDDIVNDSLYSWANDGWTVYTLAHKPDNMPDDLYDSFCEAAYNENGEDQDYDYRYYTFITEKHIEDSEIRTPLLSTTWSQNEPYNNSDTSTPKRKLGCVTIAVAQLMRFYESPSYSSYFPYSWSSMPNHLYSIPETNLCNFLFRLRQELNINNEGSGYSSDAKNVLEDYGYQCSLVNHNATAVYNSLKINHPVFMGGQDVSYGGHAWVSDGFINTSSHDTYRLYVFRYDGYHSYPAIYDLELEENANYQSYFAFHMNWGWNGNHDGYFQDSALTVQISTEDHGLIDYNPSSSRKDLFATPE